MKIRKEAYFILILLSVFVACSMTHHARTVGEIKQKLNKIDCSDGVTKQEAIFIAQNYLLENPPKDNPQKVKVDIFKVIDTYEADTFINVHFDFLFENDKPFLYPFYWAVKVDKRNGKILESKFAGHK